MSLLLSVFIQAWLYQAIASEEYRMNKSVSEQLSMDESLSEQQSESAKHESSYVSLCLILKDQNEELREWILYHRYIGVDKFYIFDDLSNSPAINTIQDLVDEGLVSYFYLGNMYQGKDFHISFATSAQTYAYNCCLRWFGHKHTFMGFIDVDEFVVLRNPRNIIQTDIVSFLKQYEDHGGLILYWRLFGSSGIRKRQISTLKSYIKCVPSVDDQDHVPPGKQTYKSFLNIKYSSGSCGNHHCKTRKEYVNTNFEVLPWGFIPRQERATWNLAFLNHYRIKSVEDFMGRQKRGSVHNPTNQSKVEYGRKYFDWLDHISTHDCLYMRKIVWKCCADILQPARENNLTDKPLN